MKRLLSLVITLALAVPALHAQSQRPVVFAVSTIKPSNSTTGSTRFFFTPTGLSIENLSLQTIIVQAYAIQEEQLMGTPAWAKEVHYDIEAKVDDEDREALKKLSQPERASMVQALLADRFGLKTHNETHDLRILALVVAKSGLKITPSVPPADPKIANHGIYFKDAGELHATDCPLTLFAQVLSRTTHHIIVDKTGLTAHYDFTLRFTDESSTTETDSTAPSLYTALQEQLGLKLDATKAPMPVLVVDSIAQPTPN
jgi:uncharacterized protein (TIGR03435 family)